MCLNCLAQQTNTDVLNKEKIAKAMDFYHPKKTFVHSYNGELIKVSKEQFEEIRDNAIALVATGVDMSFDIWAVQWPREYTVKTL